MSKMGQFVFEVQEVVCENYNEPFEVVREKVIEKFKDDYAVSVAKIAYDTIHDEMRRYF